MCCEFQTSAKLETKPGSLYKNGNHGNSFVTEHVLKAMSMFITKYYNYLEKKLIMRNDL